jgi:MSHA type pilus biogenesis protein MshL
MIGNRIVFLIVFLLSAAFLNPSLTEAEYPEEQGELISLDIKGMDIRDVFKILSQKSGLNIVSDNDVQGLITLYVKDVGVMEVLDIVASTNDLAYEEEGSLIRIMTNKRYEKSHGKGFRDAAVTKIIKLNYADAEKIAKAVGQMKTGIGKIIPDERSNTVVLIDIPSNVERIKNMISEMDVPLVTEIFSLDYGKADLIKEKLARMISQDAGSVRFDERTNKIVVQDTPEKIEQIKKVVAAFDEKTREVIIDANIIQVTLSDKYSYGIDWAAIASMADIRVTGDTNLSTGLTGVTPSTLTIGTTGGNYTTVLSLLNTFGETNVLSRPRITVADREEARILVGAKEVYVTSEVTTTSGGTYHTTDHVQFVDVGVSLIVTPEINKAGYIKLKIKPEVSSTDSTKTVELKNPDGSTRTIVPFVTTSEAETTVIVKDNTTLIIGGLMKDTVVKHKEKVPFLGDVPLLGKLFSTTGKSKEKTELVIFFTPHIIEGDKTTEDAGFYLGEWDKKAKLSKIEEPKEPELKIPESWKAKKDAKPIKKKPVKEKKEIEKKPVEKPEKVKAEIKVENESVPKAEPKKEKKEKKTVKPKREKKSVWTRLFDAKVPEKAGKSVRPAERSSVPEQKPYEKYYLIVRDEINNIAKNQDVSGLKGEVELEFTLDKEGFLIKTPVVLNKPDLKLVRAAVNCVKKAVPFPPFFKGMKDAEEFSIVVRYE